jgi:hypothetical protein
MKYFYAAVLAMALWAGATHASTTIHVIGPQFLLLFGDQNDPNADFAYLCTEPYSVVGDSTNAIFINCTVVRKPKPGEFLTCEGIPDKGILKCPTDREDSN